MALSSLSVLGSFKADKSASYPVGLSVLYSPVDNVHGALQKLIGSCNSKLLVAMYGYNDENLDSIIKDKLKDPNIFVQLTLDSSQAAGVQERSILSKWGAPELNNKIAIGRSEKGAIMHLKMAVIDDLDVITGSTNWSTSGQSKQDNIVVVVRDRRVAQEASDRINAIHAHMKALR